MHTAGDSASPMKYGTGTNNTLVQQTHTEHAHLDALLQSFALHAISR